MKFDKYKTRLGFFMVFGSLVLALVATRHQDQPETAAWINLVAIVFLFFGLPLVMNLSFQNLLGRIPNPNYVFEPWYRQLFIRRGSGAFQIERDDLKVEFVLMRDVPGKQMDMWVYEPGKGLKNAHTTRDKDRGELVLSNGAKLYFVKQSGQIKVWWSEVNKPWKIVEEK